MAKLIPKFYSFKEPGTPNKFEKKAEFDKYFSGLSGRLVWTVQKYVPKRSNPQNSYWHGVIVKILADALGYTPKEMHNALKIEFLTIRREGKPDTLGSTAKLSTKDFNDLKEAVQVWAKLEFNVYIPDPHEIDYE